jgi:hypothetical protein
MNCCTAIESQDTSRLRKFYCGSATEELKELCLSSLGHILPSDRTVANQRCVSPGRKSNFRSLLEGVMYFCEAVA